MSTCYNEYVMDNAQKIKETVDISDHIQKTVELKKTGKNFRGICPFHREKTPSFFVSPDRQSWHCFGCNKGGDVITFVMEKEGLDFIRALQFLSETYHIPLDQTVQGNTESHEQIYRTLSDANAWYQSALLLDENKNAYDYITQTRGVTLELMERFGIGYAPNSWDKTGIFLQSKGHGDRILIDAGLAIMKEGRSGWYDRFRNRIMFPIKDRMGRVVGFTARSLDKEETAKYINSPETSVFKKSKLLYAFTQAKDSILAKDYSVIVEGTLDVISLHTHGIENTVAPLGTALTSDHIAILKRLSTRILFLFDSDKAGVDATFRSIPLALRAGMEVKVATLTLGKDPDEAFRNHPEDAKNDLLKAKDAITYAIHYAQTNLDTHHPHFQKQAADIVLPLIQSIENSIDQEAALRKLSTFLNINLDTLQKELIKTTIRTPQEVTRLTEEQTPTSQTPSKSKQLWETLVSALLQLPDSLQGDATFIELIKPLEVSSKDHPLLSIAQKLLYQLKQHGKIEVSVFINELDDAQRPVADLLLLTDLGTITDSNETYKKAVVQVVQSIRRYQVESQIAVIGAKQAQTEEDMIELNTLTQMRRKLQ